MPRKMLGFSVSDFRQIDGLAGGSWNPVGDTKTGRFENGWTIEMAIPFKSLRYNPGPNQVWGVNLRRIIRWKNEWAYVARVPAFFGVRATMVSSLNATLVGLDLPATGRNLELKPWAVSGLRTDRAASPAMVDDLAGDAGLDVKCGVTKGLTADFTYNTDFAQVEDYTTNGRNRLETRAAEATLTPKMFAAALVQYNSSVRTLTTNVRFRWEYQPGSELFVVYSDGRDTAVRGVPALQNRGFVVKVNRLFRF